MTNIQLISIILMLMSILIINIGIFLCLKRICQYLACIEHNTTLLWLNKKSKIKKRKGIIKFNKLTELPRDF